MADIFPYHVRPFVATDALSLFAAVRASLDELVSTMPWCSPEYSLAQAEAWVTFSQQAWAARTEFPLGIFETASGAVVGGAGINHINRMHRFGNLGYWVATPHTGRGVARFAAREAARLAFGEIGLSRVEIVTLTHNLASQRVAESLGATKECVARNRLFVGDAPRDAVVYSLIPTDEERWSTA
jgi:ribosomal-protein-serine acetyltransferase